MTNKALSFGYVAVLSVQFCAAAFCGVRQDDVEQRVEAVLDERGIFYDKTEVWIESEQLYEVLYSFEMEVSQ